MELEGKNLFISQAFPPQNNSTAQLLDYFFETHDSFFDKWNVIAPKHGSSVYPTHQLGPQPTSGFSRVWFAIIVFFRLLKSHPSFILSTTNPPFLLWVLAFWGRLKKIPYGFLILDLYPDCLTQTNVLKKEGLISKLWKILNRLSFQKADYIWVIGRDMKEKICKEYGVQENRTIYKPLWAPFRQPEFKWYPIKGPLKICYSGNIGLLSDLKPLLNAVRELKDQPVEFHFFGQGKRLEESQRVAEKLGLKIIIKPMVERAYLAKHLQQYHLHYVGLRDGLFGAAVPCKAYGIMASGRAILAQVPNGSEIDLIIKDYQVGINCTSDTNLVFVIKTLLKTPQKVQNWGKNAHNYYKKCAALNSNRENPFATNNS